MNRILPLATHIKPISLGGESDFALGGLHVCPSRREVRAGENKATIEPRVMQVLVVLVQSGGAIVSRDQLIERCWGGRLVVEAAINSCIAKVRALATLTVPPAFGIETIPRVGYRFRAVADRSLDTPQSVNGSAAMRVLPRSVTASLPLRWAHAGISFPRVQSSSSPFRCWYRR